MHERACAAWIRHGETSYDNFEYNIDNCPYYISNTDTVMHGHWILRTENNICDMTYQYECSQCAQPSRCRHQTNYCPNCGACMDKKDG